MKAPLSIRAVFAASKAIILMGALTVSGLLSIGRVIAIVASGLVCAAEGQERTAGDYDGPRIQDQFAESYFAGATFSPDGRFLVFEIDRPMTATPQSSFAID